MEQYELLNYINGTWQGEKEENIEVINPATGEKVGSVPKCGASHTREAIQAADNAFPNWSRLAAGERAAYLRKVYDIMLDNKEELARIMTLEMGKPLSESRGEVQYAASFMEWYAEEGKRVYGRTIPGRDEKQRIQVLKQPVGVVAAITPWNFPAAMITRKMAPALAAGCTFIVKPPQQTPLTAIKLMEYCQRAGIPAGVVNLVTGKSSAISGEFMKNDKVRKVTFTGSTEVGKILIEQSAQNVKKVSMELGGHAPFIVLDDADIDKAVQGAVASKYRNGGQTCICLNRLYVQENIYDQFVDAYAQEVKKLKVGNGLDEDVHIGPVIDREGFKKIDEHVRDALEQGAQIVIGGKPHEVRENAFFYQPTVMKNVTPDMKIMHEETFGPVAPVQKFATDEEVIQLANHSPYGLAAYFYTENINRGTKLMEQLEYGIIGWNDGVPSAAQAPFGGMKESGLGREGGQEGIEEYLETKYVSIGL